MVTFAPSLKWKLVTSTANHMIRGLELLSQPQPPRRGEEWELRLIMNSQQVNQSCLWNESSIITPITRFGGLPDGKTHLEHIYFKGPQLQGPSGPSGPSQTSPCVSLRWLFICVLYHIFGLTGKHK